MSDSTSSPATITPDQMQADTVVGPESAPVPLGEVEQELAARIRNLQEGSAEPVLRARMSNLVIFCDTPALAREVNDIVPPILALHPARVLLLYGQAEGAASVLTTTVNSVAHTVSQGQKLCSEQVNVRAVGRSIQKLPFVVRSLLVGDLPVNLWWAAQQAPPLGGELFYELAADAEQVVYDSIGWPDPPRGMLAVASWLHQLEVGTPADRWWEAADLNWRRLKSWRRILTQALDPNIAPGFLETIQEIYIEHGPHAVMQAWLVVSWLASRLGWSVQVGRLQPHVEMAWQCECPHGKIRLRVRRQEQGMSAIQRMRITGAAEVLEFVVEQDGRLAVVPTANSAAAPRTVSVPPQPLAELVGRELSDRTRDPVFYASMEVARTLAQSVLG